MSAPYGARGRRFDPARADRLDDPDRFTYLSAEQVATVLDAPPDATVIDFGAGTGTYALALGALRPDLRIVALDIEPAMLERLAQKDGAEHIVRGGPELLTAYHQKFERVLAINVLHELGDADLRALFAATRDDARIAFIDWDADVERPIGPDKERVYGPADAAEHLAPFGFVVEDVTRFAYQYALFGRVRG